MGLWCVSVLGEEVERQEEVGGHLPWTLLTDGQFD